MLPILLGAAVLFGSSPLGLIDPALGQPKSKTVTYTFQGYCDGIQLTQTGTEASGLHLESGCGEADAFAGGFKGAITGHADTWDISTTDSGAGDLMETYYSFDSYGTPFRYLASGNLVTGYATHRQGVKNRLPSTWNVRTR